MCYPKPGPRCSSYAARILAEARLQASKAPPNDFAARDNLKSAQLAYEATPAGIRDLTRRLERAKQKGIPESQTEYELRLKLGIAERQAKLDAIKAIDQGDPKHLATSPEVTYDESMHRLSSNLNELPTDYLSDKHVKNLIIDSHNFTSRLIEDEIEALIWYTSNGSFSINRHLTNTLKTSHTSRGAAMREMANLQATVMNLDSALEKGKRNKALKVYRGVSSKVMESCGYTNAQEYIENTFPIGGTFTSPVFMSSTLDYLTGKDFGESEVMIEVLGTKMAPISNISTWSASEKEYVLPRKTPYEVKNVLIQNNQDSSKFYLVQLEEI